MIRNWLSAFVMGTTIGLVGCGGGGAGESGSSAEGSSDMTAADLPIISIDDVKPSQSGSVWQEIANTSVTITYDRPVARGRELFGGIVPFGDIWRCWRYLEIFELMQCHA